MTQLFLNPVVNHLVIYGGIFVFNLVGLRLLRLPPEHRPN